MRFLLASIIVVFSSVTWADSWADNVKVSGDFRYRHEMIKDESKGDIENHRQRLRARLKVKGKVNESADVTFRLASGGEGITSTNQTMGTSGANKPYDLDMAYVEYRFSDSLKMWAGKSPIAIYTEPFGGLYYDSDYTPEGVAFMFEESLGDNLKTLVNLSGTWLEENSAPISDVGVAEAQLALVWTMNEDSKIVFGLGAHNISPIKGRMLEIHDDAYLESIGSNESVGGHSTDANGGFKYEFNLTEAFLVYEAKLGEMPLSIYGNVFSNPDSEQEAYIVGFNLGKAKSVWGLMIDYNFRRVEKDSVLSLLNDSDFNGGKTDAYGHLIKLETMIAANSSLSLTYSVNKRGINAATPMDYEFGQLDFVFKF